MLIQGFRRFGTMGISVLTKGSGRCLHHFVQNQSVQALRNLRARHLDTLILMVQGVVECLRRNMRCAGLRFGFGFIALERV